MVVDVPIATFFNFFIYLLIPFIFGYIAKKIKISPVIGYIIGGIALGNILPNLVSQTTVNNFAYFGIVLLLFTVGLNVNLDKLAYLKRIIIFGGLLQIILSTLFITLVSSFFGFNLLQSILIALAFVSSSTSIVAKIIQDRGEENSFLGEIAIGILMLQDLAFIPFIIIFTQFNSPNFSIAEATKNIAIALIEATFILWGIYYFGKKIIPELFNKIAKTSRELLNLFIIIFIFMIVSLSAALNIPILIGAFIAGVLVSQSIEHYHIFSQIRPLRDITAIIFFVYIGAHIKLAQAIFLLPKILLFVSLIILVKALILLAVFIYFKFNSRVAFSLAVFLFQVSEYAFILLSLAFASHIFTSDQYILIISTVILSLMLTPILIDKKEFIYRKLRGFLKKYIPSVELLIKHRLDYNQPLDEFDLKNHIVICGYGRIGWHVGKALNLANIPFVAIDYNFQTVAKAKKEGINIIYGDPTDIDVLDFAETEQALAIISAVPAGQDQESIILNAKKLNPKIFIIGRVHNEKAYQRMKDLGAQSVVQPEVEASVSIVKKIFILKKMSKEDIVRWLKHLRLVQMIS